jgi:electron-transferring-flavoprotein dehydrogenase
MRGIACWASAPKVLDRRSRADDIGSGVDEAWETGVLLGMAVAHLLKNDKPFTRENLDETYVAMRRSSWVETEGRIAEKARHGFQRGVVPGLIGMALSGITRGMVNWPGSVRRPHERIPTLHKYYRGRIGAAELERIASECHAQGKSLHETLMRRVGWPEIEYDGQLTISQQDALLRGGKVQAPAGYADHVVFLYPRLCERCGTRICAEVCSGQAITVNPEGGVPLFDREKCIHCGACMWNCAAANPDNPEEGNIRFNAGAGGLHSGEN